MNIPEHVAIIMDGNGRWAKKQNFIRSIGHQAGVDTVRAIVDESMNLGIKAVTLYAFSTENWARPFEEVNFLMKLLENFFRKEVEKYHKQGVKLVVIGDMNKFDEKLQKLMGDAIELTKDNTKLTVALALNYGGQDEILRACKMLADDYKNGKIEEITKENFEDKLYTRELPPVDLMIRPGGECRISNFLLWQCAYAEFVFVDTLWPDFTREEYAKAIEEFSGRKRRFGKVQ